mmetsp:Transcript_22626/g.66714  ORF Transcript_22626/g.66714 Transcript_22626/m.66714 type:complete len:468 (+) Transcript_22626:235-1638(+)|eukprot:CAMPEP_0206046136 /NCGR_PEP_ID=MMETSP1466-20131121/17755_1 /ASSEMBLY_ACC=CAM_ASM_001126 /TAXON_ID=44452 /ORGANISM="Pavlova gyrans, Strain CCMP608" /LENGTH=467 /DNA_ID=CAMNT_0053421105 /DNA_START=91 /DNA_END=1494 /DNA_ORIENTATION=+
MPPKGKAAKKQNEPKRDQVDKTFGLKNKNKSKQVQKFIKETTQEVLTKEEKQRRKEKEAREKALLEKAERDAIFKPVVTQKKPPPGADPKSVVCAFFKEGKCTKGAKCKFSHDLKVERKEAKINVFADKRDADLYKDQETLEKAINDRFQAKGQRCASDIICKHFIDAVERRQYGWVWTCPNGGDKCQYRHALPPGYKLRSELEAEKLLAQDTGPSLEDDIEKQRAELKVRTPLTFEMFQSWRERKKREAAEAEEANLSAAKDAKARGREVTTLTGRQLFSFDAALFKDDANAGGNESFFDAYKAKRAQDGDGDGDEAEADYGHQAAKPLYDPAAQGDGDSTDDGEAVCEPCADGDGEDEEIEWFCDGCDGDILGDVRYDCLECGEDEFCFCVDCFKDPAKAHPHPMVKMPRKLAHASTTGGKGALPDDGAETSRSAGGGVPEGGGAPDLAAVADESLFDEEDVPDE